jgi:hypothetical protein
MTIPLLTRHLKKIQVRYQAVMLFVGSDVERVYFTRGRRNLEDKTSKKTDFVYDDIFTVSDACFSSNDSNASFFM